MRAFSRLTPVVAVMLVAGLALAACNKKTSSADDEMSMGDPNAKVKVVEYASASCPHCARFNNNVFPDFKKKYVDTGQVRYTFREFLTPPYPLAAAGFLTARCAGKDKYFTVLDAVYRAQEQMFESGDFRGPLLKIAQSAGLSEQQFNACISDEKALKALSDRVERFAKEDKIEGTPTFIINGKSLPPSTHETTLADLDAAIAAAKAGK